MSEYDSGSSDASSSDGGSSSESWSSSDTSSGSSGGGIDYGLLVGSLIENALDTSLTRQSGGERSFGQGAGPLLNPAIQALFLAGGRPVVDDRSLVRRVVEAQRWFVPIESDGSLARRTLDAGAVRAFARPLSGHDATRQPQHQDDPPRRRGKRSRGKDQRERPPAPDRHERLGPVPLLVVTALLTDPSRPSRELTGRELARAVAADVDGILLVLNDETAFGLRRDELPLLTQLADAMDLERLLVEPAPGQVEALQAARWYVPAANQALDPSPPGWGDPTIYVYTHPDRAEAKKQPLVELDGLTLCSRLADRGDYVEICVNPSRPVGSGDQEMSGLSLGPSFARGIARGVDPRPGADPLPARTLAEVILWLDLESFPGEAREIVVVPQPAGSTDGGTMPAGVGVTGSVSIQIRAKGKGDWRLVGKSYESTPRPGPLLSPVFALARPDQLPASLPAPIPPAFVTVYGGHLNPVTSAWTADSIDLGDGPTQILCAGKLAKRLYDRDHWTPSGWLASKEDRFLAARYAGWANELLKLIPPGADRLPRSSIRSIDGASFLHGRPEFRSRDWIEKQHQRHTESATRRFYFRRLSPI